MVQSARDALTERKAIREKDLADYRQGTITEEAKIQVRSKRGRGGAKCWVGARRSLLLRQTLAPPQLTVGCFPCSRRP